MTASCININSRNEFNNSTPDNKTITARILSNYTDSVKKEEALKNTFLQPVKTQLTKLLASVTVKSCNFLINVFNNIQKLKSYLFKCERKLFIYPQIHENIYKISVDQKWSDIVECIEKNIGVTGGLCHGFTTQFGMALLNESGDKKPTEPTYADFLFYLDILTGKQNYKPDTLTEKDKAKMKTFFESVLIHQDNEIIGSKIQNTTQTSKKLGKEVYNVEVIAYCSKKEEFISTFLNFIDKKVKNNSTPIYLHFSGTMFSMIESPHGCAVGFLNREKAIFYDYAQGYYNYTANEKLRLVKEFKLNEREEMEQLAETVFNAYQPMTRSSKKIVLLDSYTNDASHSKKQLTDDELYEQKVLKLLSVCP